MKLINPEACPVCAVEFASASLDTMLLSTSRGERKWARCPACRSFFAIDRYDTEKEIEHTRTKPWGMIERGIALSSDKSPMYNAILHLVRRYSPPARTLLDVGCSFGGFLQLSQQEGYQVRGMDIVPEAVEYVRGLGVRCDCATSVADLDIAGGSLGIISVLDCNYYWHNHRKELRAIHSLLSPGGLLVMRVVDTSWVVQLGFWLAEVLPKAGHRLCAKAVYDHRVSIPAWSLLRIVREEGFEVVYASPRDAMPYRDNSLKVKTAYVIGQSVWRISGRNLAPGFVFLARKTAS